MKFEWTECARDKQSNEKSVNTLVWIDLPKKTNGENVRQEKLQNIDST